MLEAHRFRVLDAWESPESDHLAVGITTTEFYSPVGVVADLIRSGIVVGPEVGVHEGVFQVNNLLLGD